MRRSSIDQRLKWRKLHSGAVVTSLSKDMTKIAFRSRCLTFGLLIILSLCHVPRRQATAMTPIQPLPSCSNSSFVVTACKVSSRLEISKSSVVLRPSCDLQGHQGHNRHQTRRIRPTVLLTIRAEKSANCSSCVHFYILTSFAAISNF